MSSDARKCKLPPAEGVQRADVLLRTSSGNLPHKLEAIGMQREEGGHFNGTLSSIQRFGSWFAFEVHFEVKVARIGLQMASSLADTLVTASDRKLVSLKEVNTNLGQPTRPVPKTMPLNDMQMQQLWKRAEAYEDDNV